MMVSGEMLIELGHSWLIVKTMEVVRLLRLLSGIAPNLKNSTSDKDKEGRARARPLIPPIICNSVGDKLHGKERNNSIYWLKFLSYGLVNIIQSAGQELHNVCLEIANLERVGNTTRKVQPMIVIL